MIRSILTIVALSMVLWSGASIASAEEESLKDALRALDGLRRGFDTPLDVVDARGAALLKEYEKPADQAQILFQLTHVHAQSGMKEPKKIADYAERALKTKLVTPAQRATLYSYLSSSFEANKEIKDADERRRKALEPLLQGFAELAPFELPEVAPEPPRFDFVRGRFSIEEAAKEKEKMEAAARVRAEFERTKELIFRRDVLKVQVKSLYANGKEADKELLEMATKATSKELAEELVATAKAERERIEKAREEAKAKRKMEEEAAKAKKEAEKKEAEKKAAENK